MNHIEMVFREPVTIILSLVLTIGISPQLTSSRCCCCRISGLIIGRIGKSLKKTGDRAQRKAADLC